MDNSFDYDAVKWWGKEPAPSVNLRYAPKILAQARPILDLIISGGGPLDRAVQEHQRAKRMGKNDRAILGMGVYGLARSREALSLAFGEEGLPFLLEAGFMDRILRSSIDYKLFNDIDYREKLNVADELREGWFVEFWGRLDEPLEALACGVKESFCHFFSIPSFWLDVGPWGSLRDAAFELSAGRKQQSLQLRVNGLKTTRDELISILKYLGITATFTKISPLGLKIEAPLNIATLDSYAKGLFEVQDEGSQLIAVACQPSRGDKILDFCAGGSGKGLALAAMLNNECKIVSYDNNIKRLMNGGERIQRSGAEILLARDLSEVKSFAPFDIVLVDAPCSSTGTMRRNPDVCWRWTLDSIKSFANSQLSILKTASSLVRTGGKLVYSTCSLMEDENFSVIDKFLCRNNDFTLAEFSAGSFASEKGAIRFAIGVDGYEGDGYFVTVLRKNS